jgi:hypothetical protein
LYTIEQRVNYLKVLKGWAHLKRQLMTGLYLIKPPHKNIRNIACIPFEIDYKRYKKRPQARKKPPPDLQLD